MYEDERSIQANYYQMYFTFVIEFLKYLFYFVSKLVKSLQTKASVDFIFIRERKILLIPHGYRVDITLLTCY